MRIEIKVYPSARCAKVVEGPAGLKVYTPAPPEKGKANRKVLEMVAAYLGVRKSQLRLVRGSASRQKVIEVSSSA